MPNRTDYNYVIFNIFITFYEILTKKEILILINNWDNIIIPHALRK